MSKLLISNFVPEGFRPGLTGPLHEQLGECWHRLTGLKIADHRLVILTDSLELESWDKLLQETLSHVRVKHVDLAFSREAVADTDRGGFRSHLESMVDRLSADGITATWSALEMPGRHFQSKGYALVDERATHVRDGILVLTSADLTAEGFGYDERGAMELGIWTTETDSLVHFLELFESLRGHYRVDL